MAKRVSLKGRGADIFFGDYSPPADPANPAPESALPESADRAEERAVAAEPAAGELEPERPIEENARAGQEGRRNSGTSKLASKHTSLQTSKQANMHASLQGQREQQESAEFGRPLSDLSASKHASLHASTSGEQGGWAGPERAPARDLAETSDDSAALGEPLAELDGEIWARVDAAATITSSFRYTESELTALTDVLYDVSKQYSARVTKQDVARLALNAVLNDYYQRGPSSLLGRLATRRRRHSGGR